MGLTGVVLDATIALLPIETSRCVVDTHRTPDLDAVLALMSEGDHRYRYSVAWLDLLATGSHLGRGVLTRGDHAPLDALGAGGRADPLKYHPRVRGSGPADRARPGRAEQVLHRDLQRGVVPQSAQAPGGRPALDPRVLPSARHGGSWNRLYGRRGFIQYQFVVPFGEESTLERIVERCSAIRAASFVTVLKRFGDSNPAPLSFPTPGWTLTIDLSTSQPGLAELARALDDAVLAAGGRHYLAKDALTSPEVFRRGYPRLDEWRAIRDKADPTGVWRSDQARRLGLV